MLKREWLKIKDVRIYAGVSDRTVKNWIYRMGLRHTKVGGIVRIKRAWLDEFLESHEREAGKKRIDRVVDQALKNIKQGPGKR